MIFCGLKSDVIFARWLLEALRDYIDRAGTFFVVSNCLIGPERSMAYKSFVLGACARVVERLRLAITSTTSSLPLESLVEQQNINLVARSPEQEKLVSVAGVLKAR